MESETAYAAAPPPAPVEGVPTAAHGVLPVADEVGPPSAMSNQMNYTHISSYVLVVPLPDYEPGPGGLHWP